MAEAERPPLRRYAPKTADSGGGRLPVIWTVSISRLSQLLHDITPEFDHRADIEAVNAGFEDAARLIKQRLQRESCDVIVAAGSNGAYLKNRIDVPVVPIQTSGFDLMQALTHARKLSTRIGVVTHETDLPVFAAFQRSFRLKIEQRAFVTAEDARTCVGELVANGVDVIIGTGMVTDLAEQAGVVGILMYSAESVRQAFERALDLASVIGRAKSPVPPLRANTRRTEGSGNRYELTDLLGDSPAMTALRERLGRYAASEATVLIRGATGTGKELAAQALHSASRRRTRPFVAVNCGAIAESLLESELFGYEDGAFTGSRRGGRVGLIESADGGTLFLDEIGEMPLALQTRLLRVLEQREVVRVGASRPVPVDVRVVAATHCDLAQMVEARQFRLDLYYRLNVLYLALPTLAERCEDLPLLVQHFLKRGSGVPLQLDAAALALLRQHSWPGNVRELRNILERLPMFVGNDAKLVDTDTLLRSAPELAGTTLRADASSPARANLALPSRRRGVDRATVAAALQQTQGDREAAAKLLGVSRTTLWRWLALQGKSADSA